MKKICSRCKQEKNIENFYNHRLHEDGYSSWCIDCYKEYKKEYYQKNKEEIKKLCKKRSKIYYKLHKKERKNYYNHHKEEIKIYRLTPISIYKSLQRSAERRHIEFNLNKEDFINWYDSQEKKCYYCKRTLDKIKQDLIEPDIYKNRLTIDRKDNQKGYTLDNITLVCGRCNMTKSNYFTEKEMFKIAEIIKNKYEKYI
jgi:hypothetical protein